MKYEMASWKRILFAAAVGLGALVGGTWLLSRALAQREASCQGKPLDYWIEQLKDHDAAASNRAFVVVNSMIIPQLTDQMVQDTHDSSLRITLIEKLNNLPGVDIQFATAPFRRAAAARWLGEFGPAAKAAVPALLKVLKGNDDTVRVKAAEALGRIHSDSEIVIPALISCLNDPRSDLRTEAAEALASWGKQSRAAVPRLVQLLEDRSDRDLMAAVPEALKKIDPEAAAKAGVTSSAGDEKQ
jgi:HEAT repeat protein